MRRDIPMTEHDSARARGWHARLDRAAGQELLAAVDRLQDHRPLDSATSTVSGRETVSFRNNSDSAMKAIVLRLDQNIFRPALRTLVALISSPTE